MQGLTMKVQATVELTGRQWEIFDADTMVQCGEMTNMALADHAHDECVAELNKAASEALSCGDPQRAMDIWDEASAKWADWGATDSEPTRMFERMWQKVYTEREN